MFTEFPFVCFRHHKMTDLPALNPSLNVLPLTNVECKHNRTPFSCSAILYHTYFIKKVSTQDTFCGYRKQIHSFGQFIGNAAHDEARRFRFCLITRRPDHPISSGSDLLSFHEGSVLHLHGSKSGSRGTLCDTFHYPPRFPPVLTNLPSHARDFSREYSGIFV